jgi:hypothetical protein
MVIHVELTKACQKIFVFQKFAPPSPTQIGNLVASIDLANSDGANLCTWDGDIDATSDENTLISNLGTFDILLALNPDNEFAIWSTMTQDAVANALTTDDLQKLLVYDRFVNFDAQIPGLVAGAVFRDFSFDLVDPVSPGERPNEGPAGTVGSWTGCSSNHGYINNPPGEVHYVRQGDQKAISVQFCFASKIVYYSSTPADFYLDNAIECDDPAGSANKLFANTLTKVALETCGDQPPTCPTVVGSVSWLPPNNKFKTIDVSMYPTDPENIFTQLEITSCASSDKYNPRYGPDCFIVDGSVLSVKVRAKRSGKGNGRLYKIGYHAVDGAGQECSGEVFVCIPHDGSIAQVIGGTNVAPEDLGDLTNTNPSGHVKRFCPDPGAVNWQEQLE